MEVASRAFAVLRAAQQEGLGNRSSPTIVWDDSIYCSALRHLLHDEGTCVEERRVGASEPAVQQSTVAAAVTGVCIVVLQFSKAVLSYDFAIEITTPPATMSIPPIANVSEGICLKTSHEISWAIDDIIAPGQVLAIPQEPNVAFFCSFRLFGARK